MDFGKIFGRAFRYPLNYRIFSIIFVYNFFVTLPTLFFAPPGNGALTFSEFKSLMYIFVPLWIVSFFVSNFLAVFYFHNSSKYFKNMKYFNLGKSYKAAKERYFPFLITQILILAIMLISFLFFVGLFFLPALFGLSNNFSVIFGIIIGLISLFIIGFFIFLSPVVCLLEKKNPLDSLKKSFDLIKVNKSVTFVFWIVLIMFMLLISFIGSVPEALYSYFTGREIFIFSLVQILFTSYTGLFSYSSQVNFYLSISKKVSKRKHKKKKTKKKKK